MTIKDFIQFHTEKAQILDVFNAIDSDDRITVESISTVEQDIGCKLPKNYVDFCIEFGGGYFGFTIIHSMDIKADFYIGNVLKKFSYYLPKNYLPFSDDQTGGFYCFKIMNNEAYDVEIFYIDEVANVEKTNYSNFFDYVIANAYPPS